MFTRNTKIFGILGYPLGHTLSPWIHNTLFRLANIDAVYLVFEIPKVETLGILPFLQLGISGLSVTIPYKEWAYSISETACETSKIMKASNTLLLSDSVSATNTDGLGALTAILRTESNLVDPSVPKSLLLLGSGGSAKGILFAIAEHRKSKPQNTHKRQVKVLARNHEAVLELCDSLGNPDWLSPTSVLECQKNPNEFDLVIHTTPVGMKGYGGEPILDASFFRKEHTLFDIVYNPRETVHVKEARKKGARCIPGIDMLLYQGIKQFELFTQTEAKEEWILEVKKILDEKLTN